MKRSFSLPVVQTREKRRASSLTCIEQDIEIFEGETNPHKKIDSKDLTLRSGGSDLIKEAVESWKCFKQQYLQSQ